MSWRKIVKDAIQSSLNPRRWSVVMECGHETWVTARSRPKRATCKKCISGVAKHPAPGAVNR